MALGPLVEERASRIFPLMELGSSFIWARLELALPLGLGLV